jgi:hypothetical protein
LSESAKIQRQESGMTRCIKRLRLGLLVALSSSIAVPLRADTTAKWKDATTGNWSSTARWDGGVVPNNNMTDMYFVIIDTSGTYTATLDINAAINGFTLNSAAATFFGSGRTFTVNGDTTLTNGTVQWRDSTWNGTGTISNNAMFIAEGSSIISSAFANAGALTIRATNAGDSTLALGTSFTNSGTVVLHNEDGGNARAVTLSQTAGTFQNNSGGVLTIEQGPGAAGASRILTIANLQNGAGAIININSDTFFNASNGQLNNAGALNVATNKRLSLQNGSDLSETAGTISLADGANIYLNNSGAVLTQSGGSLVMSGMAYIQGDPGATFNFNGGSIDTSANTRTDGQVLINGGNLNFGTATPLTGLATFYVSGSSNLTGNIPAGMTVRAAGTSSVGDAVLSAADNVTNNGILRLANDDVGNNRAVTFTMAAGKTLTNSGTIDLIKGPGPVGARNVIANLDNHAAFDVANGVTATVTGAFAQTSGDVNVLGTLNVAGGTFTAIGGTLSGSGATNINAGFNLASTLTKQDSGTATITGSQSLAAGGALNINGGKLKFNVTSGTVAVGTGITATVAAGATLELAGSISALAVGANRVNINNGSAASGLLISGTHQQVGNIDGAGTTQITAGSDLTANHIVQDALTIGGAVGNRGRVTIASSDSSGNALGQADVEPTRIDADSALGPAVTTSSSGGGLNSASLVAPSAEGFSGDSIPVAGAIPTRASASVPEPSTLVLACLALIVSVSLAHRSWPRMFGRLLPWLAIRQTSKTPT